MPFFSTKKKDRLRAQGVQPRGFYTEEVRRKGGGERTGFDVITLDGRRGPLARTSKEKGRAGQPTVRRVLAQRFRV